LVFFFGERAFRGSPPLAEAAIAGRLGRGKTETGGIAHSTEQTGRETRIALPAA